MRFDAQRYLRKGENCKWKIKKIHSRLEMNFSLPLGGYKKAMSYLCFSLFLLMKIPL